MENAQTPHASIAAMPAWLIWILIAVGLATAEAVSLDFVLSMYAVGALAGSASAALGLPAAGQVTVALVAGTAMVFFVRPAAKRHLLRGAHPSGIDRLLGADAIVLDEVTPYSGLVRLNGGEWTARTEPGAPNLPVNTVSQVIRISGAIAVVGMPMQKPADPVA
jgi:membrane protein implicated in regulation of membrane protease activity